MMTAKDIYNAVLNFSGGNLQCICLLHRPCQGGFCADQQKLSVIDFDAVKTKWNKQKGMASSASVDALVCGKLHLCFVELKGWTEFLKHHGLDRSEEMTEKEKEKAHKVIDKQVGKYKLQKKLLDSVMICEDISGQKDILNSNPIAFLWVTDISLKEAPLQHFHQQLMMLAYTSTSWEKVCAEQMKKILDEQISCIHSVFVECKDFDRSVLNL